MTNSRLPGSISTTIPQLDRHRAQAPPPLASSSVRRTRPVDRLARGPDKLVERQRAPVSNGHNLGRPAASSPAPLGKDEEPLRGCRRSGGAGRKAEKLLGLSAHVARLPGLAAPGQADCSRHALGLLGPRMRDQQTLGRAPGQRRRALL